MGAVTTLLIDVLIFAGVLTLLIALIALARYRRVIARWMKAAAEAGATGWPGNGNLPCPLGKEHSTVPLLSIGAAKGSERASPFRSAAIAGAARASRRAAWVYALAGLGLASVGSVLWPHLERNEIRLLPISVTVLAYAWPVVLTLALLWGPDRRRLGLLLIGYFGVLLAFCIRMAFSELPPLDVFGMMVPPFFLPLVSVAMQAAPTLFLLLFLNRRVRAIGTVLLLLMIIVGIGGLAATVAFSTYAGMTVQRLMPFLGYGMPFQLPYLALLNTFKVGHVIAMLLFLPLGWLAIAWVRYLYDRKWFTSRPLSSTPSGCSRH